MACAATASVDDPTVNVAAARPSGAPHRGSLRPTLHAFDMRVNDVGGVEGFGRLEVSESDPPFDADWEAHVYALTVALVRRGVYSLDEFRDAVERIPPAEYLTTSYYERWFKATTTLLREKGVLGG